MIGSWWGCSACRTIGGTAPRGAGHEPGAERCAGRLRRGIDEPKPSRRRPGRVGAAAVLVGILGVGMPGCQTDGTGPDGWEQAAFLGATLIDGTGADPVPDAVLVVRAGRVECAGSREECLVPEGVATVDLDGGWVAPGLVDAHVHFGQTGWADGRPDGFDVTADHPFEEVVARQKGEVGVTYRSYLCSGVTAVYDVGGFPWTWDLREDAAHGPAIPSRGGLRPPHVAASGPLVTWVEPRLSLPGEKTMVPMEGETDGRGAVRYMAAFGSDAVKVWYLGVPEEDREEIDGWLHAVGEEAREREIPLIVHATSLREARVAVEAGADLLVHSVTDREVDDDFLGTALEQGTVYTPTLIVGENWGELHNHAALGEEPELDDPHGCVDPDTRERIRSTAEYRDHPAVDGLSSADVERRREAVRESRAVMAENLRRVHEAGIPVAMGTDAGNPLTVHGPSVYPELERMQEAGIDPADLLVMATRNGARAMGREDEIGTLEAGKVADFLVLDADPLEDIAHLRRLTHVAREGRLLPVEEISFR